MAIFVQPYSNNSKQTMLLDCVEIGLSKWSICGRGLNWSVHEGMNDISNVKFHLKTHSGNGNIYERQHEISNNVVCATSKGSDQPALTRSLIRAFASHSNIQ